MTSAKDAAIILLGMGENAAAEILKILGQRDVETIIDIMSSMEDLSEHEVIKALNEFFKETHKFSGLNATSGDYIKNTLVNAVGSHKAGSLMESTSLIDELKGIELLKWQPTHLIEDAIRGEHPQLISVVLLCLESEKAAQIVHGLPKDIGKEVVRRMANLAPLSQSAMRVLSDYFEEYFTQSEKFKVLTSDVMNKAANIISMLDADTENEIISYLNKENKELSDKLKEKLFPFEKLAQLDGKSIQTLLAEIEPQQLLLCLKGVDEEFRKVFLKNMSAKSAELLMEDLEALGPVKIKEVLDAQKAIIEKAKQLGQEERIIIPSARQNLSIS